MYRDMVLQALAYRDQSYATANGVHTGLSERAVRSTLGDPQTWTVLTTGAVKFCYPGLSVIMSGGNVFEVGVTEIPTKS